MSDFVWRAGGQECRGGKLSARVWMDRGGLVLSFETQYVSIYGLGGAWEAILGCDFFLKPAIFFLCFWGKTDTKKKSLFWANHWA